MLAATFVFSGIVKLIDPVGTQYKIEDYAAAFGFGTLCAGLPALLASVVLAVCEFTFGVQLLFGVRRRTTLGFMLCFLTVFTPFTLYLALTNPVSDCGCFGDAVSLTNWQTFGKNVLLLSMAVAAWHWRGRMHRIITEFGQWYLAWYTWVFALCFAAYNLYYLPVIDFRPYRIGADIRAAVTGGEGTEMETYFVMQKDGRTEEFTLEDYPDSTWTLVGTRTEGPGADMEQDGAAALAIMDMATGEDVTEALLCDTGYVFLLTMPYVENADDGVMDQLSELNDYCQDYGYRLWALTASTQEAVDEWCDLTGGEYPFLYADAVTLKTMVRSNPGLLLLHDGVVAGKWPSTALPDGDQLTAPLHTLPLAHVRPDGYIHRVLRILLWYLVPLMLLTVADRTVDLIRKRKARKKNNNINQQQQ